MQLTPVRRATLANLTGQGWALALSLAMIPVYIRWLGVEAYGLLGFHVTLLAASAVLDIGLSGTVNRELARASVTDHGAADDLPRRVVRTLEWLVWPLSALLAVVAVAGSWWLAAHWLKPVALTVEQTQTALVLMGLAVAAQWPAGFYGGALAGLQRQVLLNAVNMAFAALRAVGVLAPLAWWRADVSVYFAWQVMVGLLHSLALAAFVWRSLPATSAPAGFDARLLARLKGFTGGVAAVGVTAFVLMHIDRMVLSAVQSLEAFGHYALAVAIATVVHRFVSPVQAAVYPRFSQLVAVGDTQQLIRLHHNTSQMIAAVLVPLVLLMALFAQDLISLWTANPALGAAAGPPLAVLALGYGLNGLMAVPYALQLAYGSTRLVLWQTVIGVAVAVPATWYFAQRFGGLGAAGVWLALNVLYLLVGMPLMHRRFLQGELWPWVRTDLLPVVAVSCVVIGAARWWLTALPGGLAGAAVLGGLAGLAVVLAALAVPYPRNLLVEGLRKMRHRAL